MDDIVKRLHDKLSLKEPSQRSDVLHPVLRKRLEEERKLAFYNKLSHEKIDYSVYRPGAYRHRLNKAWPIPCPNPALRAQWPVSHPKPVKVHEFCGTKLRSCKYCDEAGHDARDCHATCLICLRARYRCDPKECDVSANWLTKEMKAIRSNAQWRAAYVSNNILLDHEGRAVQLEESLPMRVVSTVEGLSTPIGPSNLGYVMLELMGWESGDALGPGFWHGEMDNRLREPICVFDKPLAFYECSISCAVPAKTLYHGFVPAGYFDRCLQDAQVWDESIFGGQVDVRVACPNRDVETVWCDWRSCQECRKQQSAGACPKCGVKFESTGAGESESQSSGESSIDDTTRTEEIEAWKRAGAKGPIRRWTTIYKGW